MELHGFFALVLAVLWGAWRVACLRARARLRNLQGRFDRLLEHDARLLSEHMELQSRYREKEKAS